VRGDFHRHTELSWDGGGGTDGSLQDFYRYMIDAAEMDFGASTDHQGGAFEYWWWYTQKMTDMYHLPGKYVPIYGFERSVTQPFGHRNILYAERSGRVVPFFMKTGVQQFELPLNPIGERLLSITTRSCSMTKSAAWAASPFRTPRARAWGRTGATWSIPS
jgi:hypothetical protein